MDTRTLLAGLAAGVAGFFLGWVLFGMLLMDYFEAGMPSYEGLMKGPDEMSLPLIFVGNLLYGLMLAWTGARAGARGALPGLVNGVVIGLLVYGGIALMFMAMMNWYNEPTVAVVDILANTVWSGAMGLVAGLVLAPRTKPS